MQLQAFISLSVCWIHLYTEAKLSKSNFNFTNPQADAFMVQHALMKTRNCIHFIHTSLMVQQMNTKTQSFRCKYRSERVRLKDDQFLIQ